MNAIKEQHVEFADKRVLVVDDSATMRELLRQTLYDAGLGRVHCAGSGAQALSPLAGENVDLVICDSVMEPVDGIALIRELRQQAPFKALPIVLITGHAERTVIEKARKAGVNDVLVKPIARSLLLRRLATLLHVQAPKAGPQSIEWDAPRQK